MMKAAFVTTQDGSVVSAVVAKSNPVQAFHTGSTHRLSRELDINPYGVICAGTEFVVARHDHDTGVVELRAVRHVGALQAWEQVLVLRPYDTDDALAVFQRCGVLTPCDG
jgi:hypothetical protein